MQPALPTAPWVVFCSPPYALYVEQQEAMLELIHGLFQSAPAGSMFVVEADERFDMGQLPDPTAWVVRTYAPAVVAVHRGGDASLKE